MSRPTVLLLLLGWLSSPVLADEEKKVDGPPKQKLIELGKQTTDITEPLDADGYVDYVEAVNLRMSKGVTPENNFEVVVRRVLGPEEISEVERKEYFRRLGIAVPPEEGNYFVDFRLYASELATEREMEDWERFQDSLDKVEERIGQSPWRADDYPRAAKWLTAIEDQLDAVVEGSKRTRNYTPYVSPPFDEAGPGPRMIAILLPSIQGQRALARALNKRAMLRISEGELDDAWSDLQAMHRVASHNASGVTLIEALVGISVAGMAFGAESALLADPKATPAQLRRYLDDISKRPRLAAMADKIDVGERWMGLDSVTSIGRKNIKDLLQMLNTINALSDSGVRPKVPIGLAFVSADEPAEAEVKDPMERPIEYTIDWNVTLRLMNGWYDRLVAASREPNFAKREKAFASINEDLKELAAETSDPTKLLLRLAGSPNPREELGRVIGKILVALLIPAIDSARQAEDRAVAQHDVLRLGFALQLYRSENGRSPRSLDELVPKYVKSIPDDAMTGEALSYAPSETGFVLYSLGRNRTDDGGRGYDDRTEAREDWDDIVVRVGR